MKPWLRLIFYLLLNILVSACTVLGVLFIWDQSIGVSLKEQFLQTLKQFSLTEDRSPPLETETSNLQQQPSDDFINYQVQPGDSLEDIAKKFNITVEELAALNGIGQSTSLRGGETLRIPKTSAVSVIIDGVFGAGDLDTERVLLKHLGSGEISLVGWRLEDENGNIFIFPQFPQLTLYKDGAVNIYTKKGTNTVVDLYWGLDRPLWYSGATVILRDAEGNVRFVYKIP